MYLQAIENSTYKHESSSVNCSSASERDDTEVDLSDLSDFDYEVLTIQAYMLAWAHFFLLISYIFLLDKQKVCLEKYISASHAGPPNNLEY